MAHLFFECSVFAGVWNRCLQWFGLHSALHYNCYLHFQQFRGLIGGSADISNKWQVIWFATMWTIWVNRNAAVFNKKTPTVDSMLEQVQLKAWNWISAKAKNFNYTFHNWLHNPAACLGI